MESVLVNSFLFKWIYSFSGKYLGKSKFSLGIFLLFLVIANIVYFLGVKEPNLYQILGIPRNFERKNLFAIYKQELKKSPHNIVLIEKAYDVFQSIATTVYYDKFGETPGLMLASGIIYSPASLYMKILENMPIYLILLVVYTWRSKGDKLREARKIILALSVIALTIEINYVISDSHDTDYLDQYFGLATFEKNALIHILLVPLLEASLLYYEFFSENANEKMSELLIEIVNRFKQISTLYYSYDGFSRDNLERSHKRFQNCLYSNNPKEHVAPDQGDEYKNWIVKRKKKLIIIFIIMLALVSLAEYDLRSGFTSKLNDETLFQ